MRLSTPVRGLMPRLREAPLPVLVRDVDAPRPPRTPLAGERPTSIRDAIVRWLDQEL
ncbi:hypothetical protein LZ198_31760 [Myxococcus sp. K15C18031901]|uniref:hypothetical protein n=1 Tax=Myxococcus dinghuensis TaxID=2906761 RepID=UPI0020A7E45F|nr:hypothetical protein [Myxococcus dinghuensis]MCP3103470.1 hypothetical protein [Myxococcus dinghuensis]